MAKTLWKKQMKDKKYIRIDLKVFNPIVIKRDTILGRKFADISCTPGYRSIRAPKDEEDAIVEKLHAMGESNFKIIGIDDTD